MRLDCGGDERGEVAGAADDVIGVEHALGEAAEPPVHPVLADAATRTDDGPTAAQVLGQAEQVVLVRPGAVEHDERRRGRVLRGLEDVGVVVELWHG